jgi:P pilus assembly chaperone PapD
MIDRIGSRGTTAPSPMPRTPSARGRTLVPLVALLGCLLAPVVPAAAQVSVTDLELHLQLKGDTGTLTQVIPVKNEQTTTQQVRVLVGDWVRDSLGNNQFTEPASGGSERCGARLRVFPTNFQIAPGATELIRVSYSPAAQDEGCWAIAFIETAAPPARRPDAQGSFLTLEIRTGVKIYVHRQDAHRAGIVESADVALVWRPRRGATNRRDTTQVREATVLFANTGTAHLKVRTSLEIRDLQARLLHTVPGPDAYLVPGSARYIPIALPDLGPGGYVAIVLLDYGGDEIAAAQVEFRVP